MHNKFLTKFLSSYLSPKVIFAMDLFLSVLASALTLLALDFFTSSYSYFSMFALWWMGGSLVFSTMSMLIFKSHRFVIRHTTFLAFYKFLLMVLTKVVLMGALVAVTCMINTSVIVALLCDFILSLFLLFFVRLVMMAVFEIFKTRMQELQQRERVLVYGIAEESVAAAHRLLNTNRYEVMGFLSESPVDKNLKLVYLPTYSYTKYGKDEEFKELVRKLSVRCVLYPSEQDARHESERLIPLCNSLGMRSLILPAIDSAFEVLQHRSVVRQVKIEELLGRPEINIDMDEIKKSLEGKVVMVTGAAGSIGSELCFQLASFGVSKLVLFDNAETPMYNLRMKLDARFPGLDFVPMIGSVRLPERLDYVFNKWRPQVVFHAAAYKHVPLMEENPCEAVFANVYGTRAVADKCVEYGAEMMVMISTDKAVNPTNIMGCSKRLAEIYVQSLGLAIKRGEKEGKTKFVTTRFGNVLGSNGSVIPRFREQIENGGPVTVTHPEITRYFMTIPEACRLVMEAATLSHGNEIFVFDMGQSVKIADLARKMIELAGLTVGRDIDIVYTGLRPGEKLYEEVLADNENTEPTSHDRIRIAKVREYDYAEACRAVDELEVLSRKGQITEMVTLMKQVVPEFISKNSIFELLDR